jgi:hypothetical protein
MSFPTTKKPRSISISANRPNTTYYTLSGKRSVNQFASQYYTLTVNMPPMNQTTYQEYKAFLISQKGSFSTFTFEYPIDNLGADKSNTSVVTNATHAVGTSSITADGFTVSTNDVLKGGDFIKFNSHNKVYMVTGDVNSNASGEATITIEPPLQAALADNESIDVNKPLFTVALATDDVLSSTDPTNLYSLSFDIREVL